MQKTIKTSAAHAAYNVLNTAKYAKLADADKIRTFKATRALKRIATDFEDASKDAAEKLKPENFDHRLTLAQQYERQKQEHPEHSETSENSKQESSENSETSEFSDQDYRAFLDEFNTYNRLATQAVQNLADKEETIDIEPLTEDAFALLMSSNDWTMKEVMHIEPVLLQD